MVHPLITSAFELMPKRHISIPERILRIALPFLLGVPYLGVLLLFLP